MSGSGIISPVFSLGGDGRSSGSSTPRPVMVASRCVIHTGSGTGTGNVQCMSRTVHRTCAGGAMNLQLVFGNWDNANDNPDGISQSSLQTTTASIEYPAGTFYQVRFGGAVAGTNPPGGLLVSDKVGVQIPGNTLFWVRNFTTQPSGIIPTGLGITASAGEGRTVGASGVTDQTMSGTVTTYTGQTFAPMAILGDPLDRNMRSVAFLLDSLAKGKGDSTTNESFGWMARAFQGIAGYTNLGFVGAKVGSWLTGTDAIYRLPLLSLVRPSHCFAGCGGNDIFAGVSLATVQGYLTTLWAQMRAMGITPWAWTVPPHTTSTDSWATTANQTINGVSFPGGASAFLAAIQAYNAWLPGAIAQYGGGYIDENSICEHDNVNHDGLWVVNGTANYATSDGGHPNTPLHIAIASLVNPALFNAFV